MQYQCMDGTVYWQRQWEELLLSKLYAYEFLYLDVSVISSLTLTWTGNYNHFFFKGNLKICLQYKMYIGYQSVVSEMHLKKSHTIKDVHGNLSKKFGELVLKHHSI